MISRENITGWKNSIFSPDSTLIKLGKIINSCRKQTFTLNYQKDYGRPNAIFSWAVKSSKLGEYIRYMYYRSFPTAGFSKSARWVRRSEKSFKFRSIKMKNRTTYLFDI